MQPESVSTRESIIAEALHCFAETGYDGTSLNDIAAAVGIRRPSLLHHFSSKDALYEEVFERVLSDFLGPLEESVAAGPSATSPAGWERVEGVIRVAVRLFASHRDHVRLLRREAIDGGVRLGLDLSAALRPMFDAAAGFLEREMDAGTFRRHDAQQLIITGYGALLSSFSEAPIFEGLVGGPTDDESVVKLRSDHLVSFFRAALLPT